MQFIRKGTARFMSENFGISTGTTEIMFDTGLLRVDVARKVLIRDEYQKKSNRMMKTILKIELADKYAVSESSVEKYVSKRKQ